jgi:hypothetical protein
MFVFVSVARKVYSSYTDRFNFTEETPSIHFVAIFSVGTRQYSNWKKWKIKVIRTTQMQSSVEAILSCARNVLNPVDVDAGL